MLATTDATARRAAATALREYDEPRLGGLRSIQQELGGVWDIDEADARNAVLAALQLEAATSAEGDLLEDSEEVHRRVYRSAGMAANHDPGGLTRGIPPPLVGKSGSGGSGNESLRAVRVTLCMKA